MHPRNLLLLGALGVAVLGCGDDDGKSSSSGTGGAGGGQGAGGDFGPPTSPKANVKFAGAVRLGKQVGRALGIPPDEICLELGAYNCLELHKIALGESDAFGTGIHEPLKTTTATTPLAVDRVILAGCVKRVDEDLESPSSAIIFGELAIDEAGKLADPQGEAVSHAIEVLYRRGLSRDPKPHELELSRQLYTDVEASGKSAAPARDWAVLTCLMTLTTMESLFY